MSITPQLEAILDNTSAELRRGGIEVAWACWLDNGGYSTLTGQAENTVYSLQAELGADPVDSRYTVYAIAQVIPAWHMNAALVFLASMDDAGQLAEHDVRFNRQVDKRLSTVFLPVLYRALNTLDNAGGLRSQIIQSYAGTRMTFADFFPAMRYSWRLIIGGQLTGQQATIAVDFADLLTRILAWSVSPLGKSSNIHLLAMTDSPSQVRVPLRGVDGTAHIAYLRHSSALDEGLALVDAYLDGSVSSR